MHSKASAVKYLVVEMIGGNCNDESPKRVHLQSEIITTSVHSPIPWDGPIQKNTKKEYGGELSLNNFL